ncbi:MAG: hypothetical protein ACLQMS_17335 [Desulfomonilaceae bacterium]
MALAKHAEKICERLNDDLQSIYRRESSPALRRDISLEEFDAHVKAHRDVCDKAFYEFLDLVTDPQYSNAWMAKENDKLKSEIFDLKDRISHYLEVIDPKNRLNDRLVSKLRERNETIEKLKADFTKCWREAKQSNDLYQTNLGCSTTNKRTKKKNRSNRFQK